MDKISMRSDVPSSLLSAAKPQSSSFQSLDAASEYVKKNLLV